MLDGALNAFLAHNGSASSPFPTATISPKCSSNACSANSGVVTPPTQITGMVTSFFTAAARCSSGEYLLPSGLR
ncbi:MAG: hypothetical protein Q8M06_10725 [Methanobacteriaceae archaeon]|nr:hypothetical protein [Methanobacteriaceae archaeon]